MFIPIAQKLDFLTSQDSSCQHLFNKLCKRKMFWLTRHVAGPTGYIKINVWFNVLPFKTFIYIYINIHFTPENIKIIQKNENKRD